MNLLLIRKYKYRVSRQIDDVIEQIATLTNRKWYDFSENITGRFNEDNTFTLTQKWSFVYVGGLSNIGPACLTGKLLAEGDATVIETTLRPNYSLVFVLYFLAVICLLELTGLMTIVEGTGTVAALFLAAFGLIWFGVIQISMYNLRRRFERLLQIGSKK